MDEIKKIIEEYLADKDYEAALSLLKDYPDVDDEKASLFEISKKGFVEDCKAKIEHYVQIKNKSCAEEVIENYISLFVALDKNVKQWRKLIEDIQPSQSVQAQPLSQKAVTPPLNNVSSMNYNHL